MDFGIFHWMAPLLMLYSVILILIFKVKHFLLNNFFCYKILQRPQMSPDRLASNLSNRTAFAVELLLFLTPPNGEKSKTLIQNMCKLNLSAYLYLWKVTSVIDLMAFIYILFHTRM